MTSVEPFLPAAVSDPTPAPGSIHYDFVYDPDFGAIAEATHPDGTVAYGADNGG